MFETLIITVFGSKQCSQHIFYMLTEFLPPTANMAYFHSIEFAAYCGHLHILKKLKPNADLTALMGAAVQAASLNHPEILEYIENGTGITCKTSTAYVHVDTPVIMMRLRRRLPGPYDPMAFTS